jgi:hypothetical protein
MVNNQCNKPEWMTQLCALFTQLEDEENVELLQIIHKIFRVLSNFNIYIYMALKSAGLLERA